jgi:uncharacterized membrane protein
MHKRNPDPSKFTEKFHINSEEKLSFSTTLKKRKKQETRFQETKTVSTTQYVSMSVPVIIIIIIIIIIKHLIKSIVGLIVLHHNRAKSMYLLTLFGSLLED